MTPQVIHQGCSIIPQITSTISSRSSKSSRRVEPESQSTLTTREEPGMKKIKLSSSGRSKEDITSEKGHLPPQPTRVDYSDTDDDDEESPLDYSDDDNEMKHPRTKGQIMGYGDDDDQEIMDQDQQIEKDVAQTDGDQELEDRFNHLLIEYTREKKSESGQELAILLDKMLDRGLVTAVEYSKLNSLIDVPLAEEDDITASDKEGEEEEDEESEMRSVIKETVDYIIRHDKDELSELLMELRNEVGDEFLDALIDLDLLAGKFLENEFDNGTQLLPLIEERRSELEA